VRAPLLAAVLALLLAGPASGARIYWGARIAGNVYGTGDAPFDWTAVTDFKHSTGGKAPSIIHFYSSFAHCISSGCDFYRFNTTAFERVRQHGMIPMLSWSAASAPISKNEPAFQNADIVAGRYDAYITAWAKAAKAWGHPFFLRLDREMNGPWYPWSPGVNGNTAADFVAAWRHIHDIFTSVGATNATWVWCPNVDPNKKFTPFANVYPGAAYVNWTCLDGYNFGTTWRSFDTIFHSSYLALTGSVAPTKPLMIGEVASAEAGGSKAAWITNTLATQLPLKHPKVKAFVWFNVYSEGHEWPIESSLSSQRAFAKAIASSYYAPSATSLAALPSSPIQAP
jgi:hypothetical protein